MLELVSMRMNDCKSKRRQSSSNTKRQKDNDNLLSSSSKSNANNATGRAKSPTNALSPLALSASSKAHKQRLKKRLKANQNGNQSDDCDGVSSNICKLPSSKITTEANDNF